MSGLITTSGSLDFGPLSNRDEQMLARAIDVAKVSTEKHKHGALIYRNGRVLGIGVNRARNSHPTMEIPTNAYTYHAEIIAMSLVTHTTLQGSTIYVARVNKAGKPLNSLPCRRCLIKLVSSGIKRVVYT